MNFSQRTITFQTSWNFYTIWTENLAEHLKLGILKLIKNKKYIPLQVHNLNFNRSSVQNITSNHSPFLLRSCSLILRLSVSNIIQKASMINRSLWRYCSQATDSIFIGRRLWWCNIHTGERWTSISLSSYCEECSWSQKVTFHQETPIEVFLSQRSSLPTVLGLEVISIIIFSGDSCQLPNFFRSTCKREQGQLYYGVTIK